MTPGFKPFTNSTLEEMQETIPATDTHGVRCGIAEN